MRNYVNDERTKYIALHLFQEVFVLEYEASEPEGNDTKLLVYIRPRRIFIVRTFQRRYEFSDSIVRLY